MSGARGSERRRPALGLLKLAAGRTEGFAEFGRDGDAYLGSLAPLVAFALVMGVLRAIEGAPRQGLTFFLAILCILLTPPVVADLLCRRWQCQKQWALYANVMNWAQWLMYPVLAVFTGAARLATAAGVPPGFALIAAALGGLGYGAWFHWFVARQALGLSRLRVVGLMLAGVAALYLLVVLPISTGSSFPVAISGDTPAATPPETPNGSAK